MKKLVLPIILIVAVLLSAGCQEETPSPNKMMGEIPDSYATGDTPVDFQVELLDGKVVKLSDLRGKYVLLNFWFINCPPCVAELPAFEKLSEEYRDEFEVLTINCVDRREDIEAFIEEKGYTFAVGVDEKAAIKYPAIGAPYTLILDKEGVIVDLYMGGMTDEDVMYEQYKKVFEDTVNGVVQEKKIMN